jgi:hypothetical protein
VNGGAGSATAGRETLDQSGRAFQTGQVGLRCFVMPRRSKHVPGQRLLVMSLGGPHTRLGGPHTRSELLVTAPGRVGFGMGRRVGFGMGRTRLALTRVPRRSRAPRFTPRAFAAPIGGSHTVSDHPTGGDETSVKEATLQTAINAELQTAINADPTASVLRTVQGGIPGALQRCRRPVVGPVRPCHVRGDRSLWPVGADLGSIRASQRPEPWKEQP